MKYILAIIYIVLNLLGIFLIFMAALKARKKKTDTAKKLFLIALCSIAMSMLLLFITGVVVSS